MSNKATITLEIPEGYSGIDKEKSDFDKGIIVFKEIEKVPWKDTKPKVNGYYITVDNFLREQFNLIEWSKYNRNIFATKRQAKSVQAMAELSQIIANDKRFGGPITDKEWSDTDILKYLIIRKNNKIFVDAANCHWSFLAFHTYEQSLLFLEENRKLIEHYYMLS